MATILDENTAAQMADLFSTLGDTNRVRIVAALAADELNVSQLAEQIGLTHSAVSHQLRHLRQMRLVQSRKDGRFVYYQLDDEHVEELFRCGLEHVQHG
ncbi:MAG: ArsR/SmtB family transcription factor [Chloroflexota bacterium]